MFADSQSKEIHIAIAENDMVDNLVLKRQLDSICNEFEQQWDVANRPDFSSFLKQVGDETKTRLLKELLVVDIQLRRKNGEEVSAEDYHELGPAGVELVNKLIEANDSVSKVNSKFQTDQPKESAVDSVEASSETFSLQAAIPHERIGPEKPLRINNYELLNRIGRGGMGDVFLAKHVKFETKRFAIKLLKRSVIERLDPNVARLTLAIERFENEIRALGDLHHPNILRCV